MFEKVLVANSGEIAVRIVRALEEMGIAAVAVSSELDRDALHVKRAARPIRSGGPRAAESYLNIEKLFEVCREAGAEAVHPGYGFLADNATLGQRAKRAQSQGRQTSRTPAGPILDEHGRYLGPLRRPQG